MQTGVEMDVATTSPWPDLAAMWFASIRRPKLGWRRGEESWGRADRMTGAEMAGVRVAA